MATETLTKDQILARLDALIIKYPHHHILKLYRYHVRFADFSNLHDMHFLKDAFHTEMNTLFQSDPSWTIDFIRPMSHMRLNAVVWADGHRDGIPKHIIPNITKIAMICTVCGKRATKVCGKCHRFPYCSRKCQHEDWASHKQICDIHQGSKQHQEELAQQFIAKFKNDPRVVMTFMCEHPSCSNHATFSLPGALQPLRCARHKVHGMVRMR